MRLACYLFIFYSSFVSAQEVETWNCESVLTTGLRGEGNRIETFSNKGDNWLLEVDGRNSVMTRGNNSSFMTFCEKKVFTI